MIKLRNTGEFFIANEGKRPIYIDGKPVLTGNKHKLNNNSVVEVSRKKYRVYYLHIELMWYALIAISQLLFQISCLRFIFLINQDLINVIHTEAQK